MDEEKLEFFKLDHLDRKLAFWLMDNDATTLYHWTQTLPPLYRKNGIELDPERLYKELLGELRTPYSEGEDGAGKNC